MMLVSIARRTMVSQFQNRLALYILTNHSFPKDIWIWLFVLEAWHRFDAQGENDLNHSFTSTSFSKSPKKRKSIWSFFRVSWKTSVTTFWRLDWNIVFVNHCILIEDAHHGRTSYPTPYEQNKMNHPYQRNKQNNCFLSISNKVGSKAPSTTKGANKVCSPVIQIFEKSRHFFTQKLVPHIGKC